MTVARRVVAARANLELSRCERAFALSRSRARASHAARGARAIVVGRCRGRARRAARARVCGAPAVVARFKRAVFQRFNTDAVHYI
jgi:hypothetical protein